jgi:hypothetical protein
MESVVLLVDRYVEIKSRETNTKSKHTPRTDYDTSQSLSNHASQKPSVPFVCTAHSLIPSNRITSP